MGILEEIGSSPGSIEDKSTYWIGIWKKNMYPFEIRLPNMLKSHHRSSTTQTFDNIFKPSNKVDMLHCMWADLEIIEV